MRKFWRSFLETLINFSYIFYIQFLNEENLMKSACNSTKKKNAQCSTLVSRLTFIPWSSMVKKEGLTQRILIYMLWSTKYANKFHFVPSWSATPAHQIVFQLGNVPVQETWWQLSKQRCKLFFHYPFSGKKKALGKCKSCVLSRLI